MFISITIQTCEKWPEQKNHFQETKIVGFKKQKQQNKIDKIKKTMNTFVAGASNYN